MKIDRSRFFVLTTALAAASGCTVINETGADTGVPVTDSSSADSGTGDATLDTSPGETSSDTATEASSETSSETSSDASTDGDGATCTDDVPSPSDCSAILTGTGCHDATLPTLADTSCGNWVADLKPREAKAAQDCLTALMTGAADPDAGIGPTCEGIDWSGCAASALATSCPDDTATVYCEGLLAACAALGADSGDAAGTPPTTLDDCSQLLSGMTPAGRDAVQSCVTEGGCAVPLRDCIARL